MKIAITSQGSDLNADIDPRFGRSQYFIIYDRDTETFEAVENPNITAGGGAGIQAAKIMADKKVEAVLTGKVGPNAFQTLSAAGISVYADVSGKVSDAISLYGKGSLKAFNAPSVESHHGMNMATNTEKISKKEKKRIAVASEGDQGMEAQISAHFGRCPYYTLVDMDGSAVIRAESVENPFFRTHGQPGQVPAFIRDQEAHVIIAGGMGQRAVGFFNQFGIEAVTGVSGTVGQAVQGYLNGTFGGVTPCNHESCH